MGRVTLAAPQSRAFFDFLTYLEEILHETLTLSSVVSQDTCVKKYKIANVRLHG
jgi:hypothetical protein